VEQRSADTEYKLNYLGTKSSFWAYTQYARECFSLYSVCAGLYVAYTQYARDYFWLLMSVSGKQIIFVILVVKKINAI
jgi:hypothetical protein